MFFGVVLLFRIVRRVFYQLQLAEESGAVKARICEEPCNLGKDFSFPKGRSLVASLSSYMFQFNRELGRTV